MWLQEESLNQGAF
jgi:2-oxoglutarate dehydrogenase complex dehydrogenase (E1) component-like enzyme